MTINIENVIPNLNSPSSVKKLISNELSNRADVAKENIKKDLKESKEPWLKYLKLLNIDSKKFKKRDKNTFDFYMKAYKKAQGVEDFEQNYLDQLKLDIPG